MSELLMLSQIYQMMQFAYQRGGYKLGYLWVHFSIASQNNAGGAAKHAIRCFGVYEHFVPEKPHTI